MIEVKDNKIFRVINYIREKIEDSIWEGHVYAVGGAVRDILMGKTPKDLDLVVDKEAGGISFATWITSKAGCYKPNSNPLVFPTYGTAKFNLRNIEELRDVDIECVCTRKEQYHNTTSRNPSTCFGTIEEDAQRRDLTINALYLNLTTGEVMDYNGQGFEDIENELIRTPSDADVIFKDDPLRQLRVIRFATRYGWGIEKNTWLGIVRNAYRIEIISQERITEEINKILLCEKPSKGIRALYNSGLLGYVLPEVKNLIGCKQGEQHFGDVFEHTMMVLDNTEAKLENRLAALFHDIGKPRARTKSLIDNKTHFTGHEDIGATMVGDILKRMKYSNEITDTVKMVVKNHMRFKHAKDRLPSNRVLRRFAATVSENIDIALDVINADNISHSLEYCMPNQVKLIRAKYKELEAKGENTQKIKLPINGKDIMEALNIKSSPNIGKYLHVVKEAYLDNPNITKEESLKLIKETVLVD